jgi:Domain of unknown function (DUF4190)
MAEESTPPSPQSAPTAIATRTEPLAIVSLVLAILSWLVCLLFASIPAIICGHLARSRIRRSNGALAGMGVALAALIIAYLEIPMGVLGGIMLVDMIRSDRERLHELAVEKKDITSDDNRLKVTASGFWMKRTDLNKRAALQAAYQSKELYVIVISEPKSTIPDMTLQHHHQTTREHMLKEMTNSSATAPVPVSVDGHPALQDEVNGTEKGAVLTFLHTTVDDGDAFDQILAWTLKSRWHANEAELREVTNSFHSEK